MFKNIEYIGYMKINISESDAKFILGELESKRIIEGK